MSDIVFNTGIFVRLHSEVLTEDNINKKLKQCYNPSPLYKGIEKEPVFPILKNPRSRKYTDEQINLCNVGVIPNGMNRQQCYNVRSNYRTRNKSAAPCIFNKIIHHSKMDSEKWQRAREFIERNVK